VIGNLHRCRDLTSVGSRTELRDLIGDKAAEMVLLCRDVRMSGGYFPDFSVIDMEPIDRSHAEIGLRRVPPVSSTAPDVLDTSDGVGPLGISATNALAPLLRDRSGKPTVLRTSVLWPDMDNRPPGVDTSVMRPEWDSDEGIPWLVPKLYKAYATFCRRFRGIPPEAPCRAGLIVMDLIGGLRWQGTAYLRDRNVVVEIAPWGGSGIARTHVGRVPPAVSRALGNRVAADLYEALELAASGLESGDPTAFTEVEFLVHETGRPIVMQRRTLPGGSGIFQSIGDYQGPVTDLRTLGRTDDDVTTAIAATGRGAVMVDLLDNASLDSFGLAWALAARQAAPPPAVLLITGPGSRAGMRTHLPWSLRECWPDSLVVCLTESDLAGTADRGGEHRLVSDGITCRIE
jgi:hypothetical protein